MAVGDPVQLVPLFDVIERTIALGVTTLEVAPNDPARVSLLFSLAVPNGPVHLTTRSSAAPDEGLFLGVAGLPLELYFSKHGALVGVTWFAVPPFVAGTTLTVIEVRYRYPRRAKSVEGSDAT